MSSTPDHRSDRWSARLRRWLDRLAESWFVRVVVAPWILRPLSDLYQRRYSPTAQAPPRPEGDVVPPAADEPASEPGPAPEPERVSADAGPSTQGGTSLRHTGREVLSRIKADNLTVQAAGVAFYSLLAIPFLGAAVLSLAGLVLDPDTVAEQIEDNLSGLPDDVRSIVSSQLERVSGGSSGGLVFGVIAGIVLALWSVSGAMAKLMGTLNTIYDVEETRNFARLRGTALALTVGGVVFIVAAVFVLAVLPPLLDDTGFGDAARTLVTVGRFPALGLAMIVGLGIVYQFGPNRQNERWNVFTLGATVATVSWLVLSGAFTVYTSQFSRYNETYGALGGVVVLLMWLWITALAVLVGAEINAVRSGVRPLPASVTRTPDGPR